MQATYLSYARDKTEWKNPIWYWDLVLRTRKQKYVMKNNSEVNNWKNEEWTHIKYHSGRRLHFRHFTSVIFTTPCKNYRNQKLLSPRCK